MASKITGRIAMELVAHEAIVTEAYKDAVGIWTWGVGITDASGHPVGRYKDNRQSIRHCLEAFEWLVRTAYLPAVEDAFAGFALNEAQLGAALSFHYNTGGIQRATWVTDVLRGDMAAAKQNIMNWSKAGGQVMSGLVKRRSAERDLFFDGTWSYTGAVQVIPVSKPSYTPDLSRAQIVDISGDIADLFG